VVCEFSKRASTEVLREAHRLSWNFCRAPLLITLDPVELRCWSCFIAPRQLLGEVNADEAELRDVRSDPSSVVSLSDQAARVLDWTTLVSGEFIRRNAPWFDADQRADRMLLRNLKEVRRLLTSGSSPLEEDLVHDLIARLMFVQFLFDRKDGSGSSALDEKALARLYLAKVLHTRYHRLEDILRNYNDAYRLFEWLSERFNGD
jgi:hypothetical protein